MRGIAEKFAAPETSVRPSIFLFMPQVSALDVDLLTEAIGHIAAAGFGSVNLFDLDLAPTAHQHGLLSAALRAARRHGIGADLTIHNMASVPQVAPDGGADQRELVYGHVVVAGGETFDGSVPAPEPESEVSRPMNLVGAVAVRRSAEADGSATVPLDRRTLVDVTDSVVRGHVTWSAPEGEGEWLLFGLWERSTQTPYADYFSARGTRAMTDHWDEHVFTGEIAELIDVVGETLFEDSLHLQAVQLWTRDLLAEFERRRGYALRRFLPVLFIPYLNDWVENTVVAPQTRSPDGPAAFDFADGTGSRIRNDYYLTLSELYEEHHLRTLDTWAGSHGLRYRPKPAYNASLDISSAAAVAVPNTENFVMGNRADGIRAIAGAAHLARRPVLAVESAPTTNQVGHDLYSTTWQQALSAVHGAFAAGANHAELHSFAYPVGPRAFGVVTDGPDADWPGFWAYAGPSQPDVVGPLGLAEAYGPRMPYWTHAPDVTMFLAREQLVLQQGQPQVDVAVYRHAYWSHGFPYAANHKAEDHFRWFTDTSLERQGFTYEFIGPALFGLPGVRVDDGLLDIAGPGYKALVLDTANQRDSVRGMPLEDVRSIIDFARSGLPVVVVGDLPEGTGFFGDADDDPEVLQALTELRALPGVRNVEREAAVVDALADMGVRSDFAPEAPSNVVSVHRRADDADFYFLYNQNGTNNMTGVAEPSPASFDQWVTLRGDGRPYALDAWTGRVAAIAEYERLPDGRVSTRVHLAPGQTAIIAVTAAWDQMIAEAVEVTDMTLPAVVVLSRWHLSVEDWRPGATPAETSKVRHALELDELVPWPEIQELRDVSGVGRYFATFDLEQEWFHQAAGARLELGRLFDSVRVSVNDHALGPVDPFDARPDVIDYLRPGTNTVEVEVATTLRNRLRVLESYPEFAGVPREPYGLVGPVRVVPYGRLTYRAS